MREYFCILNMIISRTTQHKKKYKYDKFTLCLKNDSLLNKKDSHFIIIFEQISSYKGQILYIGLQSKIRCSKKMQTTCKYRQKNLQSTHSCKNYMYTFPELNLFRMEIDCDDRRQKKWIYTTNNPLQTCQNTLSYLAV